VARARSPYLQITPKSRSGDQGICRHGSGGEQRGGRINGAYGQASWLPMRYVNRPHSRTALAGSMPRRKWGW